VLGAKILSNSSSWMAYTSLNGGILPMIEEKEKEAEENPPLVVP
jgi:hypothetical protein